MARLATRLAKLETSVSSTLSADASRLLVQLLGRLDALFWPHRSHDGSYRAEVRRLQVEYLNGVGGLVARASGETNWKSSHFARTELIAAGLCTALESGGQVVSLRLTPQGISDARGMVGSRLHDVATCVPLLDRLRDQGWVSESKLFQIDLVGNPSEWERLIDFMLPLLRAGLIESNSDTIGRCSFRMVDGVEIPVEPPSIRTVETWGDDEYLQSYNSERAALARLECDDGGIFIPMRCP